MTSSTIAPLSVRCAGSVRCSRSAGFTPYLLSAKSRAGNFPLLIQRWTVRSVFPTRAAICAVVNSSIIALLSQSKREDGDTNDIDDKKYHAKTPEEKILTTFPTLSDSCFFSLFY